MEKNKKCPARFKAAEEHYLLTTKFFCGNCGVYMVGESGTGRGGKIHQYYKCVTAKNKKTCKKKTAQKDWIENIVIDETIKMLFDNKVIQQITDAVMDLQTRENTTTPYLKQQLAETEKGIQNMLNAIQQGVFTTSTRARLEELENTKSELEIRIMQEEMEQPLLTVEQITFWLHKFRDMDMSIYEQRQRLIDSFINAIYLYDDKIICTFNYKEGSKTTLLSDILGSDMNTSAAPKIFFLGLEKSSILEEAFYLFKFMIQ